MITLYAHDCVIDRPLRRRDPEHLNNHLTDLVAREPEHASEHRDARVCPRSKSRQGTRRERQRASRADTPGSATAPARAEHQRPDRRAARTADRRPDHQHAPRCHQLRPTLTAVRQMRDTLVHPLGRDQLASLALMPRLATGLAHRALVRLARLTPRSARDFGGSDDGGIELFREIHAPPAAPADRPTTSSNPRRLLLKLRPLLRDLAADPQSQPTT